MKAVIYQPAKNVMQSGRGKANTWVLDYDEPVKRAPESLNGWTSADGTAGEVRLTFDSLEQATAFAEQNGLAYVVRPSAARKVRPRNYTDNFKYQPFASPDKKSGKA